MKIVEIRAFSDRIELILNQKEAKSGRVWAHLPLVSGASDGPSEPGRCVYQWSGPIRDGRVVLPRNPGYDLLICRFRAEADGEAVEGPRYVTDFGEDFCPARPEKQEISRPIGTWCNASMEDVEYMRFGYMMDEIDQAWLMTLHPREGDIPHIYNGKTYYFDRKMVEEHDRYLAPLAERGIPTLLRFINRFKYRNRDSDAALFDIIRHPGYEADFGGVEMSAVNLRTEEGLDHYCACLDFLFARYAAPGSPYGLSRMMDVGNEVNAQRIWHNAGPMECGAFMEEYAVALRLAWLLARKYDPDFRVNISLEQNFNRPYIDDPLRYYPARECLERLARITRRDGDFGWGVAAHPYPENLSYPDFYNDRSPTFSLDTPIVTMKNMEVWPALLRRPEFLYRGQPRRVIFDEQGFNTREADPYTEEQGAFAFVLACLKLRKNPAIDLFLIHRYIDIPLGQEYGLNLGLRRCLGYADEEHLVNIPGPRKLICQAIAAMDTPQEDAWIRAARAYIGPDLFDAILDPPTVEEGSQAKAETNFSV